MDQFIVINDPEHKIPPGLIITATDKNKYGNVAVLPYDPKLIALNAVGGFAKRDFGIGVALAGMPRAVAPLTVYATRECSRLFWIARVVPIESPESVTGVLNIALDTSQRGVMSCSLGDTGAAKRPQDKPLDRAGGWTIDGTADVHMTQDGLYGLAVYGAMPGARLVWAAVSVMP